MSIVQTYHTIMERIKQTVGKERITRIRTMAWLQSGIQHSRSVHLTRIASKIPGSAKKLSVADRFRCFLNNQQVGVREWYRPIAENLLKGAAESGRPLRLLIDGAKIGNGHQLLMVSLGYRRRALPIAWTWVRCKRGHSSGRIQCALLDYGRKLVPPEAEVIVSGDSEFTPLQALLASWHWFYAFRQKGSHLFRQDGAHPWQRCDSLVTQPGARRWLTATNLPKPLNIPVISWLYGKWAKSSLGSSPPICPTHAKPASIIRVACGLKKCSLTSNATALIWNPPACNSFGGLLA